MTLRFLSLYEPAVDELFEGFGSTIFRLETRQRYAEPSEVEPLGRFVDGEAPQEFSAMEGWWAEVTAGIAAGKRYSRVHVVTEPLTDYVRFEMAWAYRGSAEAGEDVRILPVPDGAPWPDGIPTDDYWLFDDTRLLRLAFAADDRFLHADLVEDRDAVAEAVRVKDQALRLATPFRSYASGFDELMRPPV